MLGKFLREVLDFLVDLLLDFLDDLFDDLLVGFEVSADVLGYDSMGNLHLANLHAALSHEDGFFSTERLGVGSVNSASHHFEVSHGEMTFGVSKDGGCGIQGGLEGVFRLAGLFHEAHCVMASSNLGPDGVVPDLTRDFEDGGNLVGFLLRAVRSVVVVMVMVPVVLVVSTVVFSGLSESMLVLVLLSLGFLEVFLGNLFVMFALSFFDFLLILLHKSLGLGKFLL